ncbi:MAG: glycosyltransferase, partial [Cyanobacteriota bacterium]|nr:glycosyltransferase [Cyanobacteriota bacterium]
LVRNLRERRPSRMLAAQQQTNIAAILARQIAGIPLCLLVSQHNQLSLLAKHDRRLFVRVLPYLARLLYPRADGIVAVSKGVAEDLAELTAIPVEKLDVIYNPIVTDLLFDLARTSPDRADLMARDKPIILGVGRLTRQKDFPTLIRAFARVRAQLDARLIILGEGEDRPQLEQLVRDLNLTKDVFFLGYVDNSYSYMMNASLFVLSSAWEGCVTVLVEAMAVGTPVVSTDCPSSPSEILEGGKYGKLVPVGDDFQLARAMVETLNSPPDSERLKTRAMEFSVLPSAQQFLDLFESLENAKV